MPNLTTDARAKCPFYHGTGERYVICEGFSKDSRCIQRFKTRKGLKRWMEKHCCCFTYSQTCPIAQKKIDMYDEQEFREARKEAGL